MYARLSSFVIWSLVAATLMFWALRFVAQPLQAPAYAVAVSTAAPMRGDLTRLFGAAPLMAIATEAAPEAPSRFRLIGVMAPNSRRDDADAPYGLALIAVDGKPAKAFAVGSTLDSNLVLQSVSLRTASLGPAQGARSVLLELPALPAPSTGVLPAPGSPAGLNPVSASGGRPPGPMTPVAAPIVTLPVPPANVPQMQAAPSGASSDDFRKQ